MVLAREARDLLCALSAPCLMGWPDPSTIDMGATDGALAISTIAELSVLPPAMEGVAAHTPKGDLRFYVDWVLIPALHALHRLFSISSCWHPASQRKLY